MTNKNNQKTNRFTNWGIRLTGRKSIPLPSIVEVTRRHGAVAIGVAGANHRFGAGENDWLGAEAYVDSLL